MYIWPLIFLAKKEKEKKMLCIQIVIQPTYISLTVFLPGFTNFTHPDRRGLSSSNLKTKDIIQVPAYKADIFLHWLLNC